VTLLRSIERKLRLEPQFGLRQHSVADQGGAPVYQVEKGAKRVAVQLPRYQLWIQLLLFIAGSASLLRTRN